MEASWEEVLTQENMQASLAGDLHEYENGLALAGVTCAERAWTGKPPRFFCAANGDVQMLGCEERIYRLDCTLMKNVEVRPEEPDSADLEVVRVTHGKGPHVCDDPAPLYPATGWPQTPAECATGCALYGNENVLGSISSCDVFMFEAAELKCTFFKLKSSSASTGLGAANEGDNDLPFVRGYPILTLTEDEDDNGEGEGPAVVVTSGLANGKFCPSHKQGPVPKSDFNGNHAACHEEEDKTTTSPGADTTAGQGVDDGADGEKQEEEIVSDKNSSPDAVQESESLAVLPKDETVAQGDAAQAPKDVETSADAMQEASADGTSPNENAAGAGEDGIDAPQIVPDAEDEPCC